MWGSAGDVVLLRRWIYSSVVYEFGGCHHIEEGWPALMPADLPHRQGSEYLPSHPWI